MIRLVLFLIVLIALGLGFSWLADRPGQVAVTWQGDIYQFDLIVMAVAVVALIVAVMVTWAIIRTILDSPYIMQNFMRRRSREQGYKALSNGFIAAGSGDAETARRMAARADRMLSKEPLTTLLKAQTALLEDRHEDAKERFSDMLDDEKTRLLGLRGLYLEASRDDDGLAARRFANKAAEIEPRLGWAGKARQDFAATSGEWEDALAALDANKTNRITDKDTYKRQRAVLLTAHAMSLELSEPKTAKKETKEALKLAPSLVPASLVEARVLTRMGDIRQASKVLEAQWKLSPHPEVADAYVHVRPGDSAVDRMTRARSLEKLRPNHPESQFTIARAALEAKDYEIAREAASALIRSRPTERAFLLMADIEDAEFGDDGRIREWLSRAVHAPRDEAWVADGEVLDEWSPVSPKTGELDAFEWKVPPNVAETDKVLAVDWASHDEDVARRRTMLAAPSATTTGVAATSKMEDAQEVKPVSDDDRVVELSPSDAHAMRSNLDARKAQAQARLSEPETAEVISKPTPVVAKENPDILRAKLAVVGTATAATEAAVEAAPEETKPANKPVVTEEAAEKEVVAQDASKTLSGNDSDKPQPVGTTAKVAGDDPDPNTAHVSHPGASEPRTRSDDERFIEQRPDDPGVRPGAEPAKGGFRLFN
ncbi:MAG: heme biosynthesis HemY N-terminal domain-containing protein [Pseudomonadota bacterium]